ncbi:Zinc finger protein [Plakobranchus ocellatus]|uniref:Zinc finger protein n=1 Tax=Plakobranchus ocellatus TaxID=259542 RepID=A0AAV3ZIF9_9GAST|nr:Zinc finger protein [Plakobranchus ocellatus]
MRIFIRGKYKKVSAWVKDNRLPSYWVGSEAIGLQVENVEEGPGAPRSVRIFLILIGYNEGFILNYAQISAPSSDLVRKGQPNPVTWGDAQERAYQAATSRSVLHLTDIDFKFVLRKIASDRGCLEVSSTGGADAQAKLPKLPNFMDRKDNLDSWLTRFEGFAAMGQWASSLSALPTRRALDCYGRFPKAEALDYDASKKALMKKYDLAEDGYRSRFRICKPERDESVQMIIVRTLNP